MDGTAGGGEEDRLYGLMEVAKRQQAAVQAALEGLAAERPALAWEREALVRGVAGLQSGTQGAVRAAVADTFRGNAKVTDLNAIAAGWLRLGGIFWGSGLHPQDAAVRADVQHCSDPCGPEMSTGTANQTPDHLNPK